MKRTAVLILCLLLTNCAEVGTASNENKPANADKTAVVAPSVEAQTPPLVEPSTPPLKMVKPNVALSSKQQKYLNESLPPQVREILEKAERFEILAEVRPAGEFDGEGMTFEPNRIVKITNETDKKNILEAFYHDAAREDSPAACYEPHHAFRATYQGKTVKVEICFSCARFIVDGESGKFDGTLVRENRQSEELFDRIVESQGIAYKQ